LPSKSRGAALLQCRSVTSEDAVDLLADRFASTAGSCIDLATGEHVMFVAAPRGSASDQARWAMRCDGLWRLRHRAVAELVDYGVIGTAKRFEAWRCGAAWKGGGAEADAAAHLAVTFLRACGLAVGRVRPESVRESSDRPVILPDDAAGYQDDVAMQKPRGQSGLSLEACGLSLQPRRAVAILSELFDLEEVGRPRVAALWGPRGAGKSTAAIELARTARLHGFVPVAVRLLTSTVYVDALEGRSLFLIDDESAGGWPALLEMSRRSPRSHVLLLLDRHDIAAVDSVALDRFPAAALRALIRPSIVPATVERRVQRAAERARGLPGRFVGLLGDGAPVRGTLPFRRTAPPRSMRSAAIAAEQPASYGVDPPPACSGIRVPVDVSTASTAGAWPVPEELDELRRNLAEARQLLVKGRHAPGERALRQAIGGLARRGDWAYAARGALQLASCLLARGRPSDARPALDQATIYGRRAGDETLVGEAAVLTGVAWIDLGRLDEADTVLSAVLSAARSRCDADAMLDGSVALARCAFWRGGFAESRRLLARVPTSERRRDLGVRARLLESRSAVGLQDLEVAVRHALDCVGRAQALNNPVLLVEALYGAGFAHLAVGDLTAAGHDLADCLRAARMARDPLGAIRARLLLAEIARRRGRRSEVTGFLRRIAARGLPPIVRARAALIAALMDTPGSPSAIVERHVAATGLRGLILFVPPESRPAGQPAAADGSMAQVLDILRLCQNAESERTILDDVCGWLRRELRAAAVGFMTREGATLVSIASHGRGLEPRLADRAIAAGVPIAPARCDDRIEAAVPVKYGGSTIGSLVARWPLGRTQDLSTATAILMMAAAAAAPVLSAAVVHRTRTADAAPELIGTSAALAAVREAIESGARAPFPVLIEGESGSGKELVARALHRRGPRRDRPFYTLNCAALPEDLIEAELFGHARGAFTGAMAERPGIFEDAHGGTLLLDEIGELAPRAQSKVLRVIQEGELRRIGENISRHIDVRLVAATNRDLRTEAAAGRFRFDLLYRLDVIRIVVPPLRERREDIPALAGHFWRDATIRVGSRAALSAATLGALARHDWPGNVRELQNVMAALAVRSPKRGVVPPTALPSTFTESRMSTTWRLDDARRTFEERFVRAALVRTGGHRARAASDLGVSRQGLTKLMSRLGIAHHGADRGS
jgi:DNA-binding NtrC family response regulator